MPIARPVLVKVLKAECLNFRAITVPVDQIALPQSLNPRDKHGGIARHEPYAKSKILAIEGARATVGGQVARQNSLSGL